MLNYHLNKLNYNLSLLLFLYLFSFPVILKSQNKPYQQNQIPTSFVFNQLCTPNPSPEAKALYQYLQNLFGEKILSGQMSSREGINVIEYIKDFTGKEPALCGFDLEVENTNETEIIKVIKWWQDGGIPLIIWNWAAPTYSEGYDNSKKEISIEKCFQEGTPEYKSFWKELETKANHLEKLRDANVPVLWCPFHEQTDKLFWWGKKGPLQYIKLWHTMFNYFVKERNLNNLIWIQSFSEDINRSWFPGNRYVDVIAASSYKEDSDPRQELFKKAQIIANSNIIPIAFNECATIPDPDECRESDAMWIWWMERPAPYLTNMEKENVSKIYLNDLIITLNEVPNIVRDYSGETVIRTFLSGTTIFFDELKGFKLGTKSGNFSINNGQLEIEASGSGFQGVKDEGYFAFKQIEGDFDISVKVLGLSAENLYTMAGIMARSDLSKKSPNVFFQVYPNNNLKNRMQRGCELKYRTEDSDKTMAIYPDPDSAGEKFDIDFPNTWIRLKRRGNLFKSYISHDNENWYIYSVHNQKMPKKLLVGLAVSSHDNNLNTKAKFADMYITWE